MECSPEMLSHINLFIRFQLKPVIVMPKSSGGQVSGRQLLVSAQLEFAFAYRHQTFCVWVAYIKRQRGIAPQVFVIKFTASKNRNEIQFSLKSSCLLWPIDNKLGVWVVLSRGIFWLLPWYL
jgi:hypothetical protein